MISSGTTAVTTNGDTAVNLIANAEKAFVRRVWIVNGAVAGFFSIDGGNTYAYLKASVTTEIELPAPQPVVVKVKRIASGTDLADVYGYAA